MMQELNYDELQEEIVRQLQSERAIVLATSANDHVTARTVWPLNDGLTVLFSTHARSEKAQQIAKNPNVALAAGNLKMEAVALPFGHPRGHEYFLREYPKKYAHLGDIYPETPDDLLFIVKPARVLLFKHLGKPCEDVLDVAERRAYRIGLD